MGLLAGKLCGVVIFCWAMIKLRLSSLPDGMGWRHLIGVGFLAGVGFTMSLFITTLAFSNPQFVTDAKVGIFAASIISGIAGYLILKTAAPYSNTLGTRK